MTGLNINGQYSEIQNITSNLMKRVLKIEEPETESVLQVAWLSSARYQKKKGYVLLEFSPQLKPYLLQLKKHFTKIGIIDTLKLKSIYSVRMFELLLQYLSIGNRRMSLYDLRSYCGIEKGEYKDYFDLKRKVINRAKTEINTKTEYEIDYEEIKESRKVTDIKWTIQKKTHFEKAQAEKSTVILKELRSKNALLDQMIEYGFSKQEANRILKTTPETDVSNAIKAVDIQVQKGNVKNPKAMIAAAIRERWHPEKYLDKKIKKIC